MVPKQFECIVLYLPTSHGLSTGAWLQCHTAGPYMCMHVLPCHQIYACGAAAAMAVSSPRAADESPVEVLPARISLPQVATCLRSHSIALVNCDDLLVRTHLHLYAGWTTAHKVPCVHTRKQNAIIPLVFSSVLTDTQSVGGTTLLRDFCCH
eukprot:jgi/Ulvmu1/11749/UM008_0163.1